MQRSQIVFGATLIKPYEFWHPRLFEAPYYLYMALRCLFSGIGPSTLPKANYALYHGEIGIGSKYDTQLAFDQSYFLPTELLKDALSSDEKQQQIMQFAQEHGFPVILKPDIGCVGKGILKIKNEKSLLEKLHLLEGDFILQKFTPFNIECGIFYTRCEGQVEITGINQKHFPTVVGNGKDTILTLAKKHYRYTEHWSLFLQYIDTQRVPAEGEEVQLSFIGSHTMGCMFTDDTEMLTLELEAAVANIFSSQPGYNFGRIDVKAESIGALKQGQFVVIEINGIASLPTHMFDPKYNVFQAYKIFLKHASLLVKIAKENKQQKMNLLPAREVWKKTVENQRALNSTHQKIKDS